MRSLVSFPRVAVLTIGVLLGMATVSAVAQSISGTVHNQSTWLNDTNAVPPHWHVAPHAGAVSNAHGRVIVALFNEERELVDAVSLAPPGTTDQVNLSTVSGQSFPYSLGGDLGAGTYTVEAWIDGNDNWQYDPGEPFGRRTISISGDFSPPGQNVTIRDDSDNDGLEDWWELHWFGSLHETGDSDFDNDGLTNRAEYDLIQSGIYVRPDRWDTDGDGMDDAWEVFYGLDPTSAVGLHGAGGDPDGDGLDNLTEYRGPDGIGPRRASAPGSGIAVFTGSTDALSPISSDSDDDGAGDFAEFVQNLTHPVHPMSSTNYAARSLDLSLLPPGGVDLPDPLGNRFGIPEEGVTIEFWIRPGSDGDGALFSYPGHANALRLSLEAFRPKGELIMNGTVTAFVGGTNDPSAGVYGEVAPLEPDAWTHVAVLWSPLNNSLELHVNGLLLVGQTVFVYPDLSGLSNPVLAAGLTDGFLDEFRFWNYPRTASDIEYWHDRLYPAPGYVHTESRLVSGKVVQNYLYDQPLRAYYRFDDAGEAIEDFANLNSGLYPIAERYSIADPAAAAAVTADEAVTLLGSDDADADGVPEWWNQLYKMDRYPDYDASSYGPTAVPCPDSDGVLGFRYYRTFIGYASMGGAIAWAEDESPSAQFHAPRTVLDFLEGHHSAYMRYVYVHSIPRVAPLEIRTPGMVSTVVYINGERVTPEGDEADTRQSYDLAGRLQIGRNQIYVECLSSTDLSLTPSGGRVGATVGDYLAYNPGLADILDCDGNPYQFERALGKFDASLSVDGHPVIVRGDQSRNDPRAVWHAQFWSKLAAERDGRFPRGDRDSRVLPANQDWGAINHAEKYTNPQFPDIIDDGLDAFYEFLIGTNPRAIDSNNNGIPDSEEDFDGDGLTNIEEQRFGSHPLLPDTDDDGVPDGLDAAIGHPASSLAPRRNLSLALGGPDYVTFPAQRRFALGEWTVEAWVHPADGASGGTIVQRRVSTSAVNYELGLTSTNTPYVRYVPNFGLGEQVLVGPAPVAADGQTWTHLAASYFNRQLRLYVDGTNVASVASLSAAPAVFAGGPVVQRIGEGFSGLIDEVRIWRQAREPDAILATHDEVLSGLESDLVAYYRFDDGTSFSQDAITGDVITGTSSNNASPHHIGQTPWRHGQIEDFTARLANDWWRNWRHAASFAGTDIGFSTNSAVLGPPSLQVFIDRPVSEDAGARWSINGGESWHTSGTILNTLAEGAYTVSFRPIDNWLAPESFLVNLVKGVSTVTNVQYIRPASLRVELDNTAAVAAEAAWRFVPGGDWNPIGAAGKVGGLTPGKTYFVDFRELPAELGYAVPTNAPIEVILAANEDRQLIARYVPVIGNVQVFLGPVGSAAEAGGRWRPTTDPSWYGSGATVGNLEFGTHTIRFQDFDPDGWTRPPDQQISITTMGQTVAVTGLYARVIQPTSIRTVLSPPAAVADGAQWRVDGGNWRDSGDVVLVAPGEYTVAYRDVAGWQRPAAETVTVVAETQTVVTGAYYRVEVLGASGTGTGRFRRPRGIAVDSERVYVADSDNHRIQVYNRSSGTWTVWGGPGTQPGRFDQPFGVTVDGAGNVWVADTGNHRVQRRDAASGAWTAFGSRGAGLGRFNGPYDVAVDSLGRLYVADYHNSRVIRRSAGGAWSVFVASGTAEGRVRHPQGLAVDLLNRVYVSDYNPSAPAGGRSRVQQFNAAGAWLAVLGDGSGENGAFQRVHGLDTIGGATLLAADAGDSRILRRGSPWSRLLGPGAVNAPRDVAIDTRNDVFVADTDNDRILFIADPDDAYTLLVQTASPESGVAIASTTGHAGTTVYSHTVAPGSPVSLEAPATVGSGAGLRLFSHWSGALLADTPLVTFTMDSSKTLVAHYIENSPLQPGGGALVMTRFPTFSWPTVAGATWYRLWIQRNGEAWRQPWVQGATTWQPTAAMPGGNYRWWVQGWSAGDGYSPWSVAAAFSIPFAPPGWLSQLAPSGPQPGTSLDYRWMKDANATWYRLWIGRTGAGVWHDQWFAMTGTGEAVVPLGGHPQGEFSWYVQGWGPDGSGPWAGPMAFSTPSADPAQPVLNGPEGAIGTSEPLFDWQAAAQAIWYRVYVSRNGTMVIDQWTQATSLPSPVSLQSGPHRWWVGSWNNVTGKTVWSDHMDFSAP